MHQKMQKTEGVAEAYDEILIFVLFVVHFLLPSGPPSPVSQDLPTVLPSDQMGTDIKELLEF